MEPTVTQTMHPPCAVCVAGLHTSAFFFGHAAMHLIDILVQPAIFMSLYYTLTLPEIKFLDYYTGPHLSITSTIYHLHYHFR